MSSGRRGDARRTPLAIIFIAAASVLVPARADAEPPPRPEDYLSAPVDPGGWLARRKLSRRARARTPMPTPDVPHNLGLVRRADGVLLYRDPGHRFSAVIAADGTAWFADRWRRIAWKDRQNGRGISLPPEGAIAFNPFAGVQVARGGRVQARRGVDPHGDAKADFLARTAEFRLRLAVAAARARIEQSLAAMPHELLAIWRDRKRPPAQRRAVLFRRWDDCDDVSVATVGTDATPASEAAAVELAVLRRDAADRARRTIEAFVRRHAPAGSPEAYPSDELAALNAHRRSTAAFVPYAHESKGPR